MDEMKSKAIVFDIWGDYAHFRKIETTTSPLTYFIPTGTALAGMISAMIGLNRDSYYDLFSPENTRLAIRIINPLRKTRINISLMDTSRGFCLRDIGKNPRTLVPCEFVKNPKYRIYLQTTNENIRVKFGDFLRKHLSFYTPSLGTANLIANFAYVNEYDVFKTDEEIVQSVVRKDRGRLFIEENKRYGLERIPVYMNQERVVQDYADVIYEVDGKPVKMSDTASYKIGSDNVVFLS
jgi:CRISPR-associated protein Cas5h